MANNKSGKQKIGSGHLQAAIRQGFAELRGALYADSNVAQKHAELGLYGTATPGTVDQQQRQNAAASKDTIQSLLDRNAHEPEPQKEAEREREAERE